MIPVKPIAEPSNFEREVAKPGDEWLAKHPNFKKRPPAYWKKCAEALCLGFGKRCGYAAMADFTGGTVDHYFSWNNFPYLAYDWENYRFVSATLNSSKKDADDAVLDPCQVGEAWFEILLPSLQMVVTDLVPDEMRAKAKFTLERLKLDNGKRVIGWRSAWYQMYCQKKITLDGLRDVAPLLAVAVEKQERELLRQQALSKQRPSKSAKAK